MARIMIEILIGFLLGVYLGSGSASNLTFRQPNFHLEFNSFDIDCSLLSPDSAGECTSYSLNVSELLPILELVSRKFSKIYTHTIPTPWYSKDSIPWNTTCKLNTIPEAVAVHNKQNQENKLELIMTICENSINLIEFSRILEVANHANSIFPGSVSYILANYENYWKGNEDRLGLGKQKELGHPIKLGSVMVNLDCEMDGVDDRIITPLVENLDLVILNLGIKMAWRNMRLDDYVSEIILKYETCKNILERRIKRVSQQQRPEVGLRIGWTAYSHGRNSDLIQLWMMLKKWSVEKNVMVFISRAFVNPGKDSGTWEVTSEDRANLQFRDVFDQKDEVEIEGSGSVILPSAIGANNKIYRNSDVFKQPNFHLEFNTVIVDDWKMNMYNLQVNQLLPILKLISAKFSKIYFNFGLIVGWRDFDCKPSAIPEAVAFHNKQNPYNKIELLLKICMETGKPLKIANDANSIFPGSVTYLLFDFHAFNVSILRKENDLGYHYKHGVIIQESLDDKCSFIHSIHIKEVIGNADLIILELGDNVLRMPLHEEILVEEYISEIILKYELCKKNINKLALKGNPSQRVPDVGLLCKWPSQRGSKWDLIEFWTTLNRWSVENNVKIFISRAFDKTNAKDLDNVVGGRWKVISKHRTNMQFQDKFEDEDEEIIEDTDKNNSLDQYEEGGNSNEKRDERCTNPNHFKQDYFHLEFNSFYVDDTGLKMYSLTVEELLPILKLVSTKYSRIYTHTVFALLGRDTYELNAIPEAVALHNEQNRENKLEVLINIYVNSISPFEFRKALQVANHANSIYPGSITHLLAEYDEFTGNETRLGKQENLEYAYKLGVIIPIAKCKIKAFVTQAMQPLIEKVDLVILDFSFNIFSNGNIFKDYVSKMTLEYVTCKDRIYTQTKSKSELHPEVGLRVDWSVLSNISNSDVSRLWSVVNQWSFENNVTVLISNAFDDTERPGLHSHSNVGRWKVKSVNRSSIQFEDKFEQNLNITDPRCNADENEETDSQVGQGIITPTLGIAIALIVGLILLVMYVKYKQMQAKRCLSRKEVSEFYKGCKLLEENVRKPQAPNDIITSIETTGYNNKFEVEKSSFRLSDCCLGSGAFGEVWKATVIKSGEEIEVAAKTLKKGCPSSSLKAFLSEIKVLGYLGQHENLVGMIAAYTKGLERGKVIVFTELCGKGSLEKYLRNLEKPCGSDSETTKIYSVRFRRWCSEIANGMEYLSSKNVVHADLATRNVLLNDALQAKISDFGLSRRLYDYTNYVKKKQEPLPWKWMSPESLKRFEFNEKTDVWAFGVTMWEIYSLGNIPYPGLNWTVDFPTQLINGLRMEKPLYDDGIMYKVMNKCWHVDSSRRPTFLELKANIEKMGLDQNISNCYKNINYKSKIYQNDLAV